MNGYYGYYAKWNKSDRQIPYKLTYMWHLLKKKKRLIDTENRSGGCQRRQGWSVKRTGWRGSKSKINSLNMINIPQMMKSSHLKTLRRITEYWVLHLEGKKPQKEYLLVSSPTPLFYSWRDRLGEGKQSFKVPSREKAEPDLTQKPRCLHLWGCCPKLTSPRSAALASSPRYHNSCSAATAISFGPGFTCTHLSSPVDGSISESKNRISLSRDQILQCKCGNGYLLNEWVYIYLDWVCSPYLSIHPSTSTHIDNIY